MFLLKYRLGLALTSLVAIIAVGLFSCSATDMSEPKQELEIKDEIVSLTTLRNQSLYKINQFEFVYEPSGLLRLPNGEVLVIEDEPRQALSALSFGENGYVFRTPIDKPRKRSPGRLEDLEGIASDGAGHYFAITSHSKTPKGRLPSTRKKLIRFTLDNYAMNDVATITSVKKHVVKQYSDIRKAISGRKSDLNIEALSYHRGADKLMLGLRTPLIDDQAVIIAIENPNQAFSKKKADIKFAKKLITLNLDKGGIRAIAYDEHLGGYLILSRREDKKEKSFKLWLWDGKTKHNPQRIRLDADFGLDFAEGVTPISTKSMAGLLFVFDDGDARKARGAHYTYLPYESILVQRK